MEGPLVLCHFHVVLTFILLDAVYMCVVWRDEDNCGQGVA
jgi:hypothetical protein